MNPPSTNSVASHFAAFDLLSWIAIAISVLSLAVSIYQIYRDRSKLIAFSEISHDGTKDSEKPPPFLRVLAVNQGNRPITLTDFGLHVSKRNSAWSPLKPEPLLIAEDGLLEAFPANLAHDIGIKLEDGDVYELRITPEDYEHLYSSVHDFREAKKYFFKDVLGKKILCQRVRERYSYVASIQVKRCITKRPASASKLAWISETLRVFPAC